MQKAHSNINWENLPSKNTPLGAYLLNKQDREIDVIDDRVLALYGYQDRVAQSEKNAKESEVNAKTSETNAKQSELLAKQYAEKAFSGTPEGYGQLIEDVRLIDIKETTDTTLANSKDGGYKLLSMSGKTVQKKYSGKNLLNPLTVEHNFVGSGLSIATNSEYDMYEMFEVGEYVLSWGKNSTGYVYIIYYDENKNIILRDVRTASVENSALVDATKGSYFRIMHGNPSIYSGAFPVDVQLEKGTVATDYEPYCGGTPSPNPSYPQSLNHPADCVEMVQGYYNADTGIYAYAMTSVCSKNKIPCKAGDNAKIKYDGVYKNIYIFFYGTNGFISAFNTNGESYIVPSGATHFTFRVDFDSNTDVATVGKITLTINGKYVLQIREHGKNFLSYDKTVVSLVKSSERTKLVYTNKYTNLPSGTYKVIVPDLKMANSSRGLYCQLYDFKGAVLASSQILTEKDGVFQMTFTTTEDSAIQYAYLYLHGSDNDNATATFSEIMIVKDDVTDYTYEPYKEKVATVLLDAPLCETDVMSRTEVVRNRHTIDLGTLNWTKPTSRFEAKLPIPAKPITRYGVANILCTSYPAGSYGYMIDENIDKAIGTYMDGQYIELRDSSFTDVTEFKNAMSGVIAEYELATPTIEVLDTDSQIALNSLETFNGVTYINVDSRVLPAEIKGEYGTSKVGARTLKNELRNDTLEIKYNELAVALVATESGV